jgi:hypothetical protein
MSKEDILDRYESTRVQMGYENEDKVDMWERGCVEQAMDQYSRQQSIAFAEWMLKHGCRNTDSDMWKLEYDPLNEIIDPKYYTSEELFSIFLTHQSQSK